MLGTIAPRWPRAFTALGFGAAAIYLMAFLLSFETAVIHVESLEERSQSIDEAMINLEIQLGEISIGEDVLDDEQVRLLETQLEQIEIESELLREQVSSFDRRLFSRLINLNFEIDGESSRVIVGAGFLFLSYVVGQIAMFVGRIVTYWPPNDRREVHRVARISQLNNSVLIEELERYYSSIDLMSGLVFLALSLLLGSAIGFVFFSVEFPALLASLFILVSLTGMVRQVSLILGKRLDEIVQVVDSTPNVDTASEMQDFVQSRSKNNEAS